MACVFCDYDPKRYLAENEYFYAIQDKYPVAKGHTLIVLKRHCSTFFELTPEEVIALQEITLKMKQELDVHYSSEAYNLAMNCGRAAGQSIDHFHLHIIPRKASDKVHAFRRIREGLF